MNYTDNNSYYYAVEVGNKPGIYNNYTAMLNIGVGDYVKNNKSSYPVFRKYKTKEEAELALAVGIKEYSYVQSILNQKALDKKMILEYEKVNTIFKHSKKRIEIPLPKGCKRLYKNGSTATDETPLKQALDATVFRRKIKDYLSYVQDKTGRHTCLSKFDSENDCFLGDVSEALLRNYILYNYCYADVKVSRYADHFSKERIDDIIKNKSLKEEDINYILEYYYDKWDLALKRNGYQLLLDVKSAATNRWNTVDSNWEFLYPVIQAERHDKAIKEGEDTKEVIVSMYYCANERTNVNTIKDVMLTGCIDMEEIKKSKIIHAGEKTPKGIKSQIDNYLTYLKDYTTLEQVIEKFIIESNPPERQKIIKQNLYEKKDFRTAYLEANQDINHSSMYNYQMYELIETMVPEDVKKQRQLESQERIFKIIGGGTFIGTFKDLLLKDREKKQKELSQKVEKERKEKMDFDR